MTKEKGGEFCGGGGRVDTPMRTMGGAVGKLEFLSEHTFLNDAKDFFLQLRSIFQSLI